MNKINFDIVVSNKKEAIFNIIVSNKKEAVFDVNVSKKVKTNIPIEDIFNDVYLQFCNGEYSTPDQYSNSEYISKAVDYMCVKWCEDNKQSVYLNIFDKILRPNKEIELSGYSILDLASIISPETIKTQ